MDVFADVILFVEVLLLFLEDFEESLDFGLRWRVEIEVIEDELTFVIDIVNNLHESYGPFILSSFDSSPLHDMIPIGWFYTWFFNNIIDWIRKLITIFLVVLLINHNICSQFFSDSKPWNSIN